MNAPRPHQIFGLGTLLGHQSTDVPIRSAVRINGRGVFATVHLSFELAPPEQEEERLFLVETPWDAVLCSVACDGQPLDPQSAGWGPALVTSTQLQMMESELSEISTDLTVLHLPAGQAIKQVEIEYLLALELLWHRGGLAFRSRGSGQRVEFSGRWDLTGLASASIRFSKAASPCRLETLEAARYRWSESLTVSSDEDAWLDFSLDENKAASIAVFSPSGQELSRGVAAVAVIAPVRAQAQRESVRLAILVEARNPQEVLLLRQMVEALSEILRPGDEISLWLLGTDSPGELIRWTDKQAVTDEILAKLLEPSVIGRAPDLWENLAALQPRLRGATHFILASNGAPGIPTQIGLGELPVFVFATGRKPYRGALEGLAQRSSGALSPGTADSIPVFIERLKVRLSPPLLSDFKLEGWGIEKIHPSGSTNVYSDHPTLVLGEYEGLLPKTVTLSGMAPTLQKLAQRVRVETLPELDLAPLYRDRRANWEGQGERNFCWASSQFQACRLSHPGLLPELFQERKESLEMGPADSTSLDMFAAPTITVAFDDPPPESGFTDFSASDTFEGPSPSVSSEPDLFDADSFFSAPPSGRPMVIFQGATATPGAGEPDLFEDPSELGQLELTPLEERPFEVPSGPPIIAFAPSDPFADDGELGERYDGFESERLDESDEVTGATLAERPGSRASSDWSSQAQTVEPGQESSPASVDEVPLEATTEGAIPEWLEKFRSLEHERAQFWLESCPIDHLGLAASAIEAKTADDLLSRLSPLRQRAVRTQMAWGQLLEEFEREQAGRHLALSLTQELISN